TPELDAARRGKEQGPPAVASLRPDARLELWLPSIALRPSRPQTAGGYPPTLHAYIKPSIGHIRLVDLTPDHIRQMHDAMRSSGLAEASVRQTHAISKRALKVAVFEGKLGVSPAERMESPSTETAERQQLNLWQAQLVLRAA